MRPRVCRQRSFKHTKNHKDFKKQVWLIELPLGLHVIVECGLIEGVISQNQNCEEKTYPATIVDDLCNADKAHPHTEAHQPPCVRKADEPQNHHFRSFVFAIVFAICTFAVGLFSFACVGKPRDPGHCHVPLVLRHIWVPDAININY